MTPPTHSTSPVSSGRVNLSEVISLVVLPEPHSSAQTLASSTDQIKLYRKPSKLYEDIILRMPGESLPKHLNESPIKLY
jgi:hypothetical protein